MSCLSIDGESILYTHNLTVQKLVWTILLCYVCTCVGTQTDHDMSQVEHEISELSSHLRNLEAEVSQQNRQGSQASNEEIQRMENEIRGAENELRQVQNEIQRIHNSEINLGNRVSAISSNEIALEGKLMDEMKQIEQALHHMLTMSDSNAGDGDMGANNYEMDADYHAGSDPGSNQGHAFNIPQSDSSSDSFSPVIQDDVYEADIDYFPPGQSPQSDGIELMAFQAQLQENTNTGEIIGIVFGSLLGLIVILSVMFGCVINAILWIRRRSGSKAESTLLTSK